MAQRILKAAVDGPDTGWNYENSTDIAVVMDKAGGVNDETDRINVASQSGNLPRHDWYVDKLLEAESIEQVDSEFYVRNNLAGETIAAFCHDGTNESVIRDADPGGSASNYTQWSDTDISHPTNASWAPTDFPGGSAGVYFGVYSSANLAGAVFCTAFELSLDVTPPDDSFALFVAMWLPPLLGVASHGVTLGELAGFFRAARRRPNRPLEVFPNRRRELEAIAHGLLVRPRFA